MATLKKNLQIKMDIGAYILNYSQVKPIKKRPITLVNGL